MERPQGNPRYGTYRVPAVSRQANGPNLPVESSPTPEEPPVSSDVPESVGSYLRKSAVPNSGTARVPNVQARREILRAHEPQPSARTSEVPQIGRTVLRSWTGFCTIRLPGSKASGQVSLSGREHYRSSGVTESVISEGRGLVDSWVADWRGRELGPLSCGWPHHCRTSGVRNDRTPAGRFRWSRTSEVWCFLLIRARVLHYRTSEVRKTRRSGTPGLGGDDLLSAGVPLDRVCCCPYYRTPKVRRFGRTRTWNFPI